MLQHIRDKSQGFIAKVIIGVIVAVFALFGVESIIGGFTTLPPAAEVNGEEITQGQLQSTTQVVINSIGEEAEEMEQAQLEQIALGRLIQQALLRQSAEAGALSVSDAMVDAEITFNIPQFQVGGAYDPDLAMRAIVGMGFTVPLYREEVRRQLLLNQLISAYSATNFLLESELEAIAQLLAQTRDFRYLPVTLGSRTADTPVTDEEIQAYYEDNPAEFTDEETVVVNYVELNQDAIAAEIAVDEAELLSLYEQEREDFESSVERRASHILFETGAGMTEAEALSAAAAAKARLDAGEDFGALALELSADTVSAEQGGDIGFSDGTAFPEAVEAALEALEVDAVSEPVTSEFGVHLVKLTETAEAAFPPFDEVRERIEREAKSSEVELIYTERLEDLSNLAFESEDLQLLSERLGLEVRRSEPFGRSGGIGVFAEPDAVEAAFSDSVFFGGNNSDVLELSESQSIVLRLEESTPATLRTLDEVEAEITVLLRAAMEREAVQEIGSRLVSAVSGSAEPTGEGDETDEGNGEGDETEEGNAGADEESNEKSNEASDIRHLLAELARQGEELEWQEQTAAGRDAPDVSPQVLEAVFAMPPPPDDGTPRYENITLPNGTFVLMELSAVTPGSIDDLTEEERAAVTQQLQTELGTSDISGYLAYLQRTAEIRTPARDESTLLPESQ